jgi:hypothetical protein
MKRGAGLLLRQAAVACLQEAGTSGRAAAVLPSSQRASSGFSQSCVLSSKGHVPPAMASNAEGMDELLAKLQSDFDRVRGLVATSAGNPCRACVSTKGVAAVLA